MVAASLGKRRRNYNLRRIKATWPYTAPEVAKTLGIHKNAVLRWLKEGLRANRDKRPFLIRGDELIRFLSARQQSRRQKCAADEFYCFKCRVPRKAYLNIADVEFVSPSRFRVKAICEVCSTALNKMQGAGNLAKIQQTFHVQQLAELHLNEGASPNLKRDKEPSNGIASNLLRPFNRFGHRGGGDEIPKAGPPETGAEDGLRQIVTRKEFKDGGPRASVQFPE